MLNDAMNQHGYASLGPQSSLNMLQVVLNENEKIKEDMRQLMEATLKDRQQIELNQREAIKDIPQQISKQYQAVIDEYGKKVEQEKTEHAVQVSDLQMECDSQRKRIIQMIEEKAQIENELNGVKLSKKEAAESLKQSKRRVNELETTSQVFK